MTMQPLIQTARLFTSRCRVFLALLALLMLASCTLPKIDLGALGGKKAADPTAEAAESTQVAAAETGEETSAENQPAGSSPVIEPVSLPEGFTQLSAADFNDPSVTLQGLILFASSAPNPFENLDFGAAAEGETQLYALAPDGQRGGRISVDGLSADLFTPANPNEKVRVVQNGFGFNHERIEAAAFPTECDPAAGGNCTGYQFSPSGHALAYYQGEDACTRSLTLYDLDGQQIINTWPNVHWMSFMQNGSLILALGDCEAPTAYFYSPKTGKQAGVEKLGKAFWNPQHTAVVYQVPGKNPLEMGLWGFNTETSKVFLWLPKESVIQDSPIWLADGKHFVFQHRVMKYVPETNEVILGGPRQVILMDAWTRAQSLLSFDVAYDNHLCQSAGEPCDQPYDEWVKTYRTPFQPLHFSVDGLESSAEARCALYGLDCTPAADLLAINWKTRKQYGWDEVSVTEVSPSTAPAEPALEAEPLYSDPDGAFALYIGRDNHSLWYVPRDREPSLWVKDASDFVYLP